MLFGTRIPFFAVTTQITNAINAPIRDGNSGPVSYTHLLNYIFLMGLAAYIVYMLIDIQNLTVLPLYDNIASFALGLVLGVLLVGALYTSRYISKIKAFKMRLLKRDK